MSNPMFDDFIELDLLDPSSEGNSDMFSYYLGSAAGLDDNATDLGAAAAALAAPHPDDEDDSHSSTHPDNSLRNIKAEPDAQPMDLIIKQEDSSDNDSHMLLDQPHELAAAADHTMTLVSPDQLTIAPHATTVSPVTISLAITASSPPTVSTAAAAAAISAIQSAVSINATAKTSSTKRSSPEPATAPRKHAKTESVSSSKSKSASSCSRKSSSASTTASATAAASIKSTTSSTSSKSSKSSSKAKSSSPEPTTLSSTPNTTLSPATLQFLLEQQEETPLIPQLFTGKLSREEIEATIARLLESTKHLIATVEEPVEIKEESHLSDDESDDNMDGLDGYSPEQSHGLKTQPGIKTDDIPSSTDLKKMTSKERRQLRNKISARNFRVRRKEYIFTLEGQVLQHKTEARHLREAVTLVQEENIRLKGELEQARRQLAETTISSAVAAGTVAVIAAPSPEEGQAAGFAAPLSKENQSLLTSILNRNVPSALNPNAKSNLTLSMPRPQSPILTPNLHKDVPNSSSGSTSQNSWKDKNPIMVHTTLIPEICFGDEFQFGSKAAPSKDDDMVDRPWMALNDAVQESRSGVFNPFWVSGVVFELIQTFVSVTLLTMAPEAEEVVVEEIVESTEVDLEANSEWELQQSLWALTQMEDEDEMTGEQIQLLYDLSQLQISTSRPESPTPAQEDPNMLEWLYESMMARLVDMDLQGSQDQSTYTSFSQAHLA